MKKHLEIIIKLIKLNFEKDMIYRLNALFAFLASAIYTITFLLGSWYVFRDIEIIKGVGFDEIFILIMLSQFWWYINIVFVRKNFQHIIKCINNGQLDLYLLKPFRLRFLIPFLQLDVRHIAPAIICIPLIIWGLRFQDISLTQVFLAILYFINGEIIVYSWTSIFASLNMSGKRNMAIFDVTAEIVHISETPFVFFPQVFRFIFVLLIPAIALVNPTYMILFNRTDKFILTASLLVGVLSFIIAEYMWKKSLKKYTSAS